MKKEEIALVIADTHFKKDNIEDVENCLIQAAKYCIENEVPYLIHVGDVFTNRTGQTLSVLLAWLNFLRFIERHRIKMFVIPGNHDKTDLESEDSYLDVVQSPMLEVIKDHLAQQFLDNLGFAFLPYFRENGSYPERLKNLVKKCGESKIDWILFTHIAVNGVKNNDGTEVSEGVPPNAFSFFDKVIVGHYHNRSSFDNIHYIGSALPHNFGEDSKKGFTVIYSTGEIEFIRNKLNKKYIKVKFDISEKISWKKIELMRGKFSNSKHNVRFVFIGTDENLSQIDKAYFNEVGIEVKKEPVSILKSIEVAKNEKMVRLNKSLIIEEFEQFCESGEVPERKYVKGLELINKSLLNVEIN